MGFTEEKQFNLRFTVQARFEEEDPPDDGGIWVGDWERGLKPRVIKAVFDALRSAPGWEVHTTSRGAAPEDEVEILVTRLPRARPGQETG